MSRAEFDITAKEATVTKSEPPQPSDPSVGDTLSTEPAGSMRRLMPVLLASLSSLVWLVGAGLYLSGTYPDGIAALKGADLLSLVGSLATPVAIFWLIALAFQRSDPTLERRLALSQNLHRALAPVEVAEARLASVTQSLKKELSNIDAVADLAADRIANLENRFQEQVSSLFSASADAEARVTSISDTLLRERDEITAHLVDTQARFDSIEQAMRQMQAALLETVDKTEERSMKARTLIDDGCLHLDQAGQSLTSTLQASTATLSENRRSVDKVASDVDLKLQETSDRIHASLDRLQGDMEGLEGRSQELGDHMRGQGQVLGELAEVAAHESEKIRSLLKTHIDEVQIGAEATLDHTRSVSSELSARSQEVLATVRQSLEAARLEIAETGKIMAATSEESAQLVAAIHDQTAERNEESLRRLQGQVTDLDSILKTAKADVTAELDGTMERLQTQGRETVSQTRSIAAQILTQVRDLRLATEHQLDSLRSASQDTATGMEDAAQKLSVTTESVKSSTEAATAAVNQSALHLKDQNSDLEQSLGLMRDQLAEFEAGLKNQQTILNTSAAASTEAISAATQHFAEQATQIETYGAQSVVSLEDILASLQTVSSHLTNDSERLRGELSHARKALGDSAHAFANERHKIRSETEGVIERLTTAATTMGGEVSRFTKSSFDAAERLETASERLSERTDQAEHTMRQAALETQETLTTSMEAISDQAEGRIVSLREDLQATLDALLKEYHHTVEQAERESAHLAMRLGREADKIASDAQRFVDKTEEIERRLAKKNKTDFNKSALMIMESLNSNSIDVYKALASDVSDTLWESYLSGDKSIFARTTVKLADRKTRKAIAERFKTDTEFKEASSRFMADFESLMERAMHGEPGSALSVTLISSDMGKLYVLLGQSLKKFS